MFQCDTQNLLIPHLWLVNTTTVAMNARIYTLSTTLWNQRIGVRASRTANERILPSGRSASLHHSLPFVLVQWNMTSYPPGQAKEEKKEDRWPVEHRIQYGQRAGGDTICVQDGAKPSAGKSIRAGPCFLQPGTRPQAVGRGPCFQEGTAFGRGIVGRTWGKWRDNIRPWVSHYNNQTGKKPSIYQV